MRPKLKLPHTVMFSTEQLLIKGYLKKEIVEAYFPADPYSVDRQFAWAVYLVCQPDDAEQYYQKALDSTYTKRKSDIDDKDQVTVHDNWIEKLLLHEVPRKSIHFC